MSIKLSGGIYINIHEISVPGSSGVDLLTEDPRKSLFLATGRGHPLARIPALPGFENLGRLSADWRRFGTLSRPVATYFANPKPAVRAVCVSHPAHPPAINSDLSLSLSPSGERIFGPNPNPRNPRYCNFYPVEQSRTVLRTENSGVPQILHVPSNLRGFLLFLLELWRSQLSRLRILTRAFSRDSRDSARHSPHKSKKCLRPRSWLHFVRNFSPVLRASGIPNSGRNSRNNFSAARFNNSSRVRPGVHERVFVSRTVHGFVTQV